MFLVHLRYVIKNISYFTHFLLIKNMRTKILNGSLRMIILNQVALVVLLSTDIVTLVWGITLSHILPASPVVFRNSVLKKYIHSSLLSNLACHASADCKKVKVDNTPVIAIPTMMISDIRFNCFCEGIFNMGKLIFF